MGFNLQSACIDDAIGEEESPRITALIREHVNASVPLGTPGSFYCLPDEMAWSWWKQLQIHAVETLGASKVTHLLAVDAWQGVYLDVRIDRLVIRLHPDSAREPDNSSAIAPLATSNWFTRLGRALGLPFGQESRESAARRALNEMYQQFGPRKGEANALQASNLRGVIEEAAAVLALHDIPRTQKDVKELLSSYSQDDSRIDEDPHIQCLCHLWLTASDALENSRPMWLIK